MDEQDAEKRERPKRKKTGGRVSSYDPQKAEYICEQLSEGIPLREICRQPNMPAWRTVYDWMYQDEDLAAAIAYARDLGYDAIAEDCLKISDNPLYGEEVTESEGDDGAKTKTIKKIDMLGHRKLQVDTRLKLLAKFNPKKYGDRVALAGDANAPLRVEVESEAERMFSDLLSKLEFGGSKRSKKS